MLCLDLAMRGFSSWLLKCAQLIFGKNQAFLRHLADSAFRRC